MENIYEINKREGGILFCGGRTFQIIRQMTEITGKNCQITKHGGWNKRGGWKILMKSINVEGGFFLWRVEFFKIGKCGLMREMRVISQSLVQLIRCKNGLF